MPSYQITPQLQRDILAFIRAGGHPEVAAEVAGVPREVFQRWMQQAKRPRASRLVRTLALQVRQAQAQARLAAEAEVFKSRPLDWLKCGPGKEVPNARGWSTPPRPLLLPEQDQVSLQHRVVQELVASLLDSLADYPEARQAAAARLTNFTGPPLPG